ncbi:hypothetical protein [Capnocytophaga catalasegens]|uniref:Uncharacterized protein n=1 Tax=Capnocytophaga catalasegens TaxID=1004260 RepID=A0AAV5AVW0_9FLAO|nr:hypothetical protein [Capnocytophaga catalasegens]GIZ15958.1 hypothetical protein RCZ03_19580 [Capnocytophaga catalasegens]GJM50445.1 hypothetical protein RCZ15_14180 [Capnocytophaga catalasegens]GJM53940.1 hypothetical protein RCZ16_22560 [Capnocytophaga catalasegens]
MQIKFYIITLFLYLHTTQAQINPSSLFLLIDDSGGVVKIEQREINSQSIDKKYVLKTTLYNEHQEVELIYDSGEKDKYYYIYYVNEPKNWQVSFRFDYYRKQKQISYGGYILLLSKLMFENFRKRGNVTNFHTIQKKWSNYNKDEFTEKMRINHAEYVYRELIEGKYRNIIRNNVYLVFSSDLDKDYIPCYEVEVSITKIQQE